MLYGFSMEGEIYLVNTYGVCWHMHSGSYYNTQIAGCRKQKFSAYPAQSVSTGDRALESNCAYGILYTIYPLL